MAQQIPLSDVLAHITDQLLKADEHARHRGQAAMRFEECELEFAVKVDKSAQTGLKVWVLNLGGSAKKTDSNTVRIKFKSLPNVAITAVAKADSPSGPKIKKQAKRKTPRKQTHRARSK